MALYLRKYWWNYLRGIVKFWGYWRWPMNWSWGQFKRACWNLDGPSEEANAEIKAKYGPKDRPPSSEAERIRREKMNKGEFDTPYFSIRYEEGITVTRGTTPYFLGDMMKASYKDLETLYKLFPEDPLLLMECQVRFSRDWREVKDEWDQERAVLSGEVEGE